MATEKKNIWTETCSSTAPYARLEEKQAAWDGYQADMPREDLARLNADIELYKTARDAFFRAKSQEELEKYAGMTLDQLIAAAAAGTEA